MNNNKIKRTSGFVLLLVFVLNVSGCATNPGKAPQPKSAASFNARLGAEYLRKGKMQLANEKLQKALQQDPESAEAHHYFALLQEALKQDDKAQTHFLRALKITPDDPQLNNNYGSFLCKQKKYRVAESHFLKASNDPLYPTPHFALTNAGVCAHEAGDLDKAELFLSKALKKQANFPPALYATAKLAYDLHDYSRAQAFLFRYNEVAGENAGSLVLCKKIHVQLGEIKKADECSAKLLKLFPNSKEAISLN